MDDCIFYAIHAQDIQEAKQGSLHQWQFWRCTLAHDLHIAFRLLCVCVCIYHYTTKLYRQQEEVTQNLEKANVRNIWQGKAQQAFKHTTIQVTYILSLHTIVIVIQGRGNTFNILTGYRLMTERLKFKSQWDQEFSLLHIIHTGSRGPPNLLIGIKNFPREWSLPLITIASPPPHIFMAQCLLSKAQVCKPPVIK
jgi:hypothetical protein